MSYSTDLNLSEEIRENRLKAKMTQDELAKEIGIGRAYLSHIENGIRRNLDIIILKKIIKVLGKKLNNEPYLYALFKKILRDEFERKF
jgi:transcriptional regulator with XRE-family HTH domain